MSPDTIPENTRGSPAGEMAARVAAHDWAATSLGPRDGWSASLKLIVATIMASRFPLAVRWGPDFVLIYNDGYAPILGEKHPKALGLTFSQTWPEVESQLLPLHEEILSGKRSDYFAEDYQLRVNRQGSVFEDIFLTFSYSPVPDDTAPAGVGGILMNAVETTKRVGLERALREREAELARVQQIGQVGGVEVDLRDGFRNRRSPEYLLIHGLPPDAVNETHEDWVRRLHPEDREKTERQFLEAARGTAREYLSEYRIIRPSDGQVRWIAVKAEFERDADGKVLRLVGAHTDITER
jgi:PAS domain S-box-containing protein